MCVVYFYKFKTVSLLFMADDNILQQLEDFHQEIEELINICEENAYGDIHDEIHSFVDFAVDSRTSGTFTLNNKEREVITRSIYDCIQFYKSANPRKVGGKYFRHPFGVFLALVNAGCTSVNDLLLGLYHDFPEEYQPSRNKKQAKNDEEELIRKALQDSRQAIFSAYSHAGFHRARAYFASKDIAFSLDRVTKRRDELYYDYISNIFSFDSVHDLALKSSRRAKFSDAYNNLEEMTTPRAMLEREDNIAYDYILSTRDKPQQFADLERLTRTLSLEGRHPQVSDIELEAPAWVKTTFKAVLVLYGYRQWCLETGRYDRVIDNIPLPELIKQRSREAINHNCSYHCGGYSGQLTPKLICDIHDELNLYKKRGGFFGVTKPSSNHFDGLFMKFFDTSVRGETRYINTLEHDRVTMTCALLVFEHLAELYVKDNTYIPAGMTRSGLIPGAPILP